MRKIKLIDLVILLGIALFSCIYQTNRVAGNSLFLFQNTDVSDTVSFVAARNNPELFSKDELFSNCQSNISTFYPPIHVFLINCFFRFTGDYTTGYIYLLWLHIFLQALGFYIFGCILFQSRYWAVLLAILTIVPVPLALGEFWGLSYDPLPRFSFSMILPYLLTAVFYWKDRPKIWPCLLYIVGIMVFIHTLSAPSWGFALWLGLWPLQPDHWKLHKRLGLMILTWFTFILGILPYAIRYLTDHVQGYTTNYALITEIMKYRVGNSYVSATYGLGKFISNLTFLRILIFGAICSLYLWFRQRDERKKLVVVFLWLLGIIFTSLVIPIAEQFFTKKYEMLPLQISLIRNLKYVFPLMLIFSLWPFVVLSRDHSDPRKRKIVLIIGFIFVFIWSSRQMYKHVKFLADRGCLSICSTKDKSAESIDALNALKRTTPPGASILAISFPDELAIRYYSLRPLAYSFKDGGTFLYANHTKLIEWYDKAKNLDNLFQKFRNQDDRARLNAYLDFCHKLKVEFLLIANNHFSNKSIKKFAEDADIVFSNEAYTIIRLEEKH
jgi:hypothetical protein